jgi:hypothetical protein
VEDFKDGIVPSCPEGSHVEHVTDRHAAAIDAAMSFELATVEVVRRKSRREQRSACGSSARALARERSE